MRDELKGQAKNNESIVINLDDNKGEGTHWICLYTKNNCCYYFDSFGFTPPMEVQKYCSEKEGYYNSFKIQKPDEVICGHYCVYVITQLHNEVSFDEILNELYKYNH